MLKTPPRAYFITFTCYGTHLHGDEPYSVDRRHRGYGQPAIAPNSRWVQHESTIMRHQHFHLNEQRRRIVLDSMVDLCKRRKWRLYAAHIRQEHVHMIVQASGKPENVMNALKAFATRRLNQFESNEKKNRKRWSRHGSTRYIWDDEGLASAVDYVIRGQGEPMACYEDVPKH
jgi:REP element-mobilizing transposase RayT